MRRYGLIVDLERCIGCLACTIACKAENGIASGSWINVEMANGQRRDTATGLFPDLSMAYLPVTCMHCEKPLCLEACPAEAIQKRDDGIVILDSNKCTGCRECVGACPYGAVAWNEKDGVAGKCNLCRHRIDKGLAPFCVLCCEGQAIHFGDLADKGSDVSRLIARRSGYVLKPEAGTEPAVFYLPPMPRRPL